MPLQYVKGDILYFADKEPFPDILVNPVNTVGAMGKGLAKRFKEEFPEMYQQYRQACKDKNIGDGKLNICFEDDFIIINLPTKKHYKDKSEYQYIKEGLIALRGFLSHFGYGTKVRVPALGCGLGGLQWSRVKKMIEFYLSDLECEVRLYEPS